MYFQNGRGSERTDALIMFIMFIMLIMFILIVILFQFNESCNSLQ